MTKWKLDILKVEENTIESVMLTNIVKAKEGEKAKTKTTTPGVTNAE